MYVIIGVKKQICPNSIEGFVTMQFKKLHTLIAKKFQSGLKSMHL